jgi:hypothetical protein
VGSTDELAVGVSASGTASRCNVATGVASRDRADDSRARDGAVLYLRCVVRCAGHPTRACSPLLASVNFDSPPLTCARAPAPAPAPALAPGNDSARARARARGSARRFTGGSRARGLSRVRLVNRDRPVHTARPIKRDRFRGMGIESLSERMAMDDFGAQH